MTENQRTISDPVALLRQADEVFLGVLDNVTPEQMALPTVNDDWDVRALINHLVQGNLWTAAAVKAGSAPRPAGDVIGDRPPREAFAESAQAVYAAFAEPGALGRTLTLPFGEMPAAAFAFMRFSDTISHTWDLAQATGQPTDIAPDLCELALATLRPRLDSMDRAQTPFKPEVPVPADASAADRLAGYLGKRA